LKKDIWEEICAAVDKEANRAGLNAEELDIVWNVLSHPVTPIPDRFRSKLIMTMIPSEERIDRNRIVEIIGQISNFNALAKLAALKCLIGRELELLELESRLYFISQSTFRISISDRLSNFLGLFDYDLCEKEAFSEYSSFCRIFFAGRTNASVGLKIGGFLNRFK